MQTVRLEVRIEGIVQGVGFRPFVHGLATRLGLGGSVSNDSQGVTIEIEGGRPEVERFVAALEPEAPPLARIERVSRRRLAPRGDTSFVIAPSRPGPDRAALVSPDVATCEDCLRELFDPADRRHLYAFTNCTNCGPRFTIVRDVPYDRAATTMASFAMCKDCEREYHDPADRRFHAQPVACPACGPRLALLDAQGRALPGEPVEGAVLRLQAGEIVAIKGLGGYHLAADAASDRAVARLRARKHREEKPFAVMARDLDAVRELAELDPAEAALLLGPRRPIVLLRRRPEAKIAEPVAPQNRSVGVMLPYTPLHHLLLRKLAGPIVLTSGNVSDEPIAYRDDEALARLGAIADAFLTHDRPIHIRTDDSVVRSFRGTPMPIRRSRGYAPEPVLVSLGFPQPVLACGAELKNTICVARGRHAFVSHHIGDLENAEALDSFLEAVEHYRRLFDVRPRLAAHDLHAEYLSTKWALDQDEIETYGVQHHHAHVASCLADNGEEGPVIGVAFDGLGYGTDGTMWGGEFLVADLGGFERAGHFAALPMPGGTAAIREPWRMAAMYLEQAFGPEVPALQVCRRNEGRWKAVLQAARRGVNAPLTSSVGRLFDAVAAVLGVRDSISYEGQAAVELEQRSDPADVQGYRAAIEEAGAGFEVRGADLIRAAVEELLDGAPVGRIGARFHSGVAEAIRDGCRLVRERWGLGAAALSGGVFQNLLLLGRAVELLEADGFRVLRHNQVPANDGGISLGQAVVAGRALARR
jgi:hydrogenase maturation protein HypF